MSAFQNASTTVLPRAFPAAAATVAPWAAPPSALSALRRASSDTGVPTQPAAKSRGAGFPLSLSQRSVWAAATAGASANASAIRVDFKGGSFNSEWTVSPGGGDGERIRRTPPDGPLLAAEAQRHRAS